MDLPLGYFYFIRRIRRGAILFQVLWLASAAMSGWALVSPGRHLLASIGFTAAVVFIMGRHVVHRRYVAASNVAQNPRLVYWIHPLDSRGLISNDSMDDCRHSRLHLRVGVQFDLDLQPQDMRHFFAWLKEQNHAVHWGPYDKLDGAAEIQKRDVAKP